MALFLNPPTPSMAIWAWWPPRTFMPLSSGETSDLLEVLFHHPPRTGRIAIVGRADLPGPRQ